MIDEEIPEDLTKEELIKIVGKLSQIQEKQEIEEIMNDYNLESAGKNGLVRMMCDMLDVDIFQIPVDLEDIDEDLDQQKHELFETREQIKNEELKYH